ncbi:MAG: Hsp20/alpha crystallin family protein [Promethearchaeota archaeon]
MRDDFDDIFDKLKKYFKLGSDIFDIDFLFIPEKDIDLGMKLDDKNIEGFKISYHFESGMDKPEIKIEGNIDEKKVKEYLKNVDLNNFHMLKNHSSSRSKEEIDASELSLDIFKHDETLDILEPYTELNEYNEYLEIVIEVPGIEKRDVIIDFSADGRTLIFTAENQNRKYSKKVNLPFKPLKESYNLDLNNGIAYIKLKKLGR